MTPTPVQEINVLIEGVAYQGTYFVQGNTVHVRSSFGAKSTQVGGSPAAVVARMLLSEMVRDRTSPA